MLSDESEAVYGAERSAVIGAETCSLPRLGGGQLHALACLPLLLNGPSRACLKAMLCCVSRLDKITYRTVGCRSRVNRALPTQWLAN
jgi:hypothetical protein